MNKQEYKAYEQAVANFFEREGINCLSQEDPEQEPEFKWQSCDCCGNTWGGNRYQCSGYNPTTKEVQSDYSICEDCLYYINYGKLDDTTMLEIEECKE